MTDDTKTFSSLWFENARRHVKMADLLLDGGFGDGAYFHLYHALECGASAVIAQISQTMLLPLDHAGKIADAEDLLAPIDAQLAADLHEWRNQLTFRNQALYVSPPAHPPWKRTVMDPVNIRPMVTELTEFLARLEQRHTSASGA